MNVRRVAEAEAWVGHTHEVVETLQGTLSSLQDAETGQRGFVITGDAKYLAPYEVGRTTVLQHLNRLAELTRDNQPQQQRVAELRPLVEQKLDELKEVIELRQRSVGGFEAARAVVLSDEGKRVMDDLRLKVAEMVELEKRLLADRTHASAVATRTAMVTNVLGLAGSLGLLLVACGVWLCRARERERATLLLSEEKEKLRATLASIGDGVLVTDRAGRITMVNATAGSILGNDEQAVGKPLDEVFHIVNEHTREPVDSPVRKVLRDGKVTGLANHTVLIRRDGSETPIDDCGAPISDQDGTLVGVVLVFRDVRERREAERELRRRAELLQEQDRRKDHFLAVLSHELRNPLAPICSSIALLRRARPGTEQALRAMDIIDRQVTQLARLVDDLLDISRITRGKVQLDKQLVRMADVVRRTVDDHRVLFSRKEVVVEYHECAEPLWVEGDTARLAQVIGNLLANAAKFTNMGGRVKVSLKAEEGRAILRVRDDGAGMDEGLLAVLFQPFMQAEATLDRAQGGLGLGLALAKDLIELHGGTVQASSPGRGEGSEFFVALPLAHEPPAAA